MLFLFPSKRTRYCSVAGRCWNSSPVVCVTPTHQCYVCHKQRKVWTYKSHQNRSCDHRVRGALCKNPLNAERYFTEYMECAERSLRGHNLHCNGDLSYEPNAERSDFPEGQDEDIPVTVVTRYSDWTYTVSVYYSAQTLY